MSSDGKKLKWSRVETSYKGKSMQNSLMEQGLELMLYGMGTVFVFLALLVLAILLMSAIIRRLIPTVSDVAAHSIAGTPKSDKTLLVVISAVIHKYRSRHK